MSKIPPQIYIAPPELDPGLLSKFSVLERDQIEKRAQELAKAYQSEYTRIFEELSSLQPKNEKGEE